MRKKYKHYSEEEKLNLLREYEESGLSVYKFVQRCGVSNRSLFLRWLHQYETEENSVSLPAEPSENDMANRSKDDYRQEIKAQKKRIRELEKALSFSKLETKARDMMIDKAEVYFDIQIRKKSGAK
ncbi:MAG: transposase [Phocaeicola sp.]|uniref:transposase n=1 Tax=Phocaeicola sp. TaxID=2773926 RepID=UPI003FA0CE18